MILNVLRVKVNSEFKQCIKCNIYSKIYIIIKANKSSSNMYIIPASNGAASLVINQRAYAPSKSLGETDTPSNTYTHIHYDTQQIIVGCVNKA